MFDTQKLHSKKVVTSAVGKLPGSPPRGTKCEISCGDDISKTTSSWQIFMKLIMWINAV